MSLFSFTSKKQIRIHLAQIAILIMGSLFVGILVNQVQNKGIHWKILLLSLPSTSNPTGLTYVSTDSAFFGYLQQEAVFVDIRLCDDFEIDHIPGALSQPVFDFFNHTDLFEPRERDAKVILYDLERNSKNVRLMARQLVKEGFKNVFIMRGGFVEWLDKTYPVEKGPF